MNSPPLPGSSAGRQPQPLPQMEFSHVIYLWLVALTATCLVTADVIGVKLFRIPLGFTISLPGTSLSISSITHTCGMITFPVTFVITDVINEFYGKKAARRAVYVSLGMAMLAFVVINVAQAMPPLDAPFNVRQDAFDHVFGSAKIMYVASLAAYVVGNIADIALFTWLKRMTKGKMIWLRATGSTVVSQFIDSFVVSYLAFSLGRSLFPAPNLTPAPFAEVLEIAATGYALKFCIAILATPVIYIIKACLVRFGGLVPLPPEPVFG